MTIKIQINSSSSPNVGGGAGGLGTGDIGSQLSGLVGQATALSGSGVGLPGLNSIGAQITTLASTITGAGSSLAGQITSLGVQMATSAMSGMSGIVSSLGGLSSQLTSLLNPAGLLSQTLHFHQLDKLQGIITSAFQGQHTTTWNQQGVTHTSSTMVTSTAPIIPHNGNTQISDILQVGKNVISGLGFQGPVFSIFSDARLKSNIKPMEPVLDKIKGLRVLRFHKKFVSHDDKCNLVILDSGEDTFGLIAQETQIIFPDVVRENDGILSIDSDKLAVLAIAAVQELADEVYNLKRQLRAK
jgi:hypothetical protein